MGQGLTEEIRGLKRRTELLAPAGRPDVLEAVLDAGADAVYLSGKQFQMRAHRGDFHFDDGELREAARRIHERGRRIYVTVNILLAGHELAAARDFLCRLEEIGIDAAIVSDLAVAAIARELGVGFELHASTMMNVHDVDQARALGRLGISRIVTSRDISIHEAGRLGERAGVPVEYFLHGDMCVAQSGHCSMSGVVLGKSANRGECMKPCRWEYELGAAREGSGWEPIRRGHLMAIRDLALIRQLPDLVEAGICALKIEGRMRDAAYLRCLVGVYRQAIDAYYADPGAFFARGEWLEALFRHRVREMSTLLASGAPSNTTFFDVSGRREPLMLSNGCAEPGLPANGGDLAPPDAEASPRPGHPELAVCVASLEAARRAAEAGADRVYLAAEIPQSAALARTPESLHEILRWAHAQGVALGVCTPRVSGARQRAEWEWWRRALAVHPVRHLLVHHLGALTRAREAFPGTEIIADTGFNLLNPLAAAELARLGAGAVVPSREAGFDDVRELAEASPLPVELIVHGPIPVMLLEHCLLATHLTRSGSKDVCRAPCQHGRFALRDRTGEERELVTDQYCRNHVLAARDLAVLPHIDAFLGLPAAVLRIEGQLYPPELIGRLTAAYRRSLDAAREGALPGPVASAWQALQEASPRPWNLGGYAQRVTHSASTVDVMRAAR